MTVDDRSAVLIIRVWVDDDSFRGRLATLERIGQDNGIEDQAYAVASSPGDVVVAVREWLGRFQQGVNDRIDSD